MNQRLMERVSARGEPRLFHTDFSACNAYADGLEPRRGGALPGTDRLRAAATPMTPPRAPARLSTR